MKDGRKINHRSEDNVRRKKQSAVATIDSRRKKVPFFLVVAISKLLSDSS